MAAIYIDVNGKFKKIDVFNFHSISVQSQSNGCAGCSLVSPTNEYNTCGRLGVLTRVFLGLDWDIL